MLMNSIERDTHSPILFEKALGAFNQDLTKFSESKDPGVVSKKEVDALLFETGTEAILVTKDNKGVHIQYMRDTETTPAERVGVSISEKGVTYNAVLNNREMSLLGQIEEFKKFIEELEQTHEIESKVLSLIKELI